MNGIDGLICIGFACIELIWFVTLFGTFSTYASKIWWDKPDPGFWKFRYDYNEIDYNDTYSYYDICMTIVTIIFVIWFINI